MQQQQQQQAKKIIALLKCLMVRVCVCAGNDGSNGEASSVLCSHVSSPVERILVAFSMDE